MTNVLIFPGKGGNPHLAGLFRAAHPELDITHVTSLDEAEAKIGDAEIFMSWGLPRDIFAGAKRLRWVSSLGTGVNGLVDAPSLHRDVIVTATRGIHGTPMSEAAFLMMLALARNFVRSVRQQDGQEWKRFPPQLLKGKTVGVVGTGAIAQDFAPRCKAFGMRVLGFSRTERPIAGFDEVRRREELAELAGTLDFLVLLVPLERDTRNLIDAKILAAMKPTAFLVNLARGAIIDEPALAEALTAGQIAGAALDTFVEEPLPKGHPLWTAPNTIVTGHLGGFSDETEPGIVAQFSQNLTHFRNGDFHLMSNRENRR
ncbi:Phosphoglycerate dehydrogenase [Rhizobium sp. CF080]|uniref:D-2-hydroxyacid dehydrogenase n=1 Tax=Rhizobium sp. (strain CF080) TaxID=1144310 RepID=UPI00027191E5|nr:D-2-hydroxyacid dehydrogenase [Rhizobium sp. CF080]EUB99173.1 Phosphoglycerate dehydrogenase [Rhizobium sp. CF080]